jgi:hypothetical protein
MAGASEKMVPRAAGEEFRNGICINDCMSGRIDDQDTGLDLLKYLPENITGTGWPGL